MYNLIMINKLTGFESTIVLMADLVTVCKANLLCNSVLSNIADFKVFKLD